MQGGQVNFVALLNGLAEELGMPMPTYHPDQAPGAGLHAAVCRFGVASESGCVRFSDSVSIYKSG